MTNNSQKRTQRLNFTGENDQIQVHVSASSGAQPLTLLSDMLSFQRGFFCATTQKELTEISGRTKDSPFI